MNKSTVKLVQFAALSAVARAMYDMLTLHPAWPQVILGDDTEKQLVSGVYRARTATWCTYAPAGWHEVHWCVFFKDKTLGSVDFALNATGIVELDVRCFDHPKPLAFPLDDRLFLRLLEALQKQAYLYLRHYGAPVRGHAAQLLRPQHHQE